MADKGNITKITLPNGDVVHIKDSVSGYATTTYVDNSIAALPEPMLFKGSVGTDGTVTWANLPAAAASNEGFTYKVITAHSAETGKPAAKVGDTIISTGSEWVVIPSGDEPSGTVTSVTIKATSPIAVDSTSAITTSGTRTISIGDAYGDTKNPYGTKSPNTVLAGPSSGTTAAAPSFRALVAADIPSITKSKISDFPTSMTPTSHTHGNIANGGTISSTGVALANGDYLLFSDSSNSGKIERSSITFDGSTATKALTQKGTWETFNNYTHPSYTAATAAAVKVGRDATGHVVIGAALTASDVGAATSGHTHTTSIASGGTATINLSANTAYTLTAGGTSVIFKTPTDNNNYVSQSSSTTANWRKLLLHYKDDSSATAAVTSSTNVVYGAVGIAAQPSTGTIRASVYRVADNVELQYNNTTKSLDFVFL